MINLMIADNNVFYANKLMNYISNKNENIRVINISLNGEDALNILNDNMNIYIFILNLNMLILSSNEILRLIKNKEKYIASCIITYEEEDVSYTQLKNNMVYATISKSEGMENIYNKINEIIYYKENNKKTINIKKLITKELTNLGYNISHKGTKYLIDSINYIHINQNKYLDNLNQELYPIIAKINNESLNNVKCYITRETNEMYLSCKIEKMKKYFNFEEDIKPNVKTVINTVLMKIN